MTSTFPYLTTLILLPAGAAVVIALIPSAQRRLVQVVGFVASLAVLGIASAATVAFTSGYGGYQFVSSHQWISVFGISWSLGMDGISLFLVLMTGLLFPIALAASGERAADKSFVAWILVLEAGCLGGFLALDLLLFFVFFELTLVPCYFIIAGWGGKEKNKAALKFFIYTFSASAFLLIGILYLGFSHQHQTGGVLTFAYGVLASTSMTHSTAIWLFVAFAIAFAAKAPIWPLHTWSPLTYAEAPTAGSIELSALLAKLGSYGLLRFAVGLFPLAFADVRPVLLTLAVIGILYGSMLACVAKDLKRFVAYSSLAQMGFITLGVMSGSKIATVGAVLLMFNHGVITIGFFLIIGFIENRRGSYQVADLQGLQGPAPVLAGVFTVVMLASIGLPGLSGFVSEYLILIGTFAVHAWWAVVGAFGVVAAAVYLLWAYQRVFQGRAVGANASIPDASTKERWVLVPIVVLIVALGVFPRPVLDRITPSVQQLIQHVAPSGVTK